MTDRPRFGADTISKKLSSAGGAFVLLWAASTVAWLIRAGLDGLSYVLIVLAVTFLVGFIIFWYMHYWTARPHEEGRVLWRGFWSPDRESLDTPTMFPDVEVARYRLHAFRLHRDVGGTLEVRADGLHWKPGVWWAPGMERASGKVELPWSCQASLGLRHPLIVAQQWANLDVMSGGRMTFVACPGEATGPTRVRELAAFNMDHGEKLARMEE